MTTDEKKEFEEFLKCKKEKESKAESPEDATDELDKQMRATENEQEYTSSRVPLADTPQTNPNPSKSNVIGILLIAIGVITTLFLCTNGNEKEVPSAYDEDVDSIEEVMESQIDAPQPTKAEWKFNIQRDEMTDTKNIWATIESDNYITQNFPYEGQTYASITIRYMKKYGYDAIIQITKGQINGSNYYGTDYITARFDEGSAKKYYFNDAADGSSEMVFLRNSSDFIKRCKQAKDIKIDIPLYQEGRPVFTFHVDEPLTWREE